MSKPKFRTQKEVKAFRKKLFEAAKKGATVPEIVQTFAVRYKVAAMTVRRHLKALGITPASNGKKRRGSKAAPRTSDSNGTGPILSGCEQAALVLVLDGDRRKVVISSEIYFSGPLEDLGRRLETELRKALKKQRGDKS